ncbi:MAG: hypothetical protein AB8H03_13910 [Saprospiraceae bacterium]
MRNTFYGILAVGLLLFSSSNIYANFTSNCKPSVHIQPVKGNYIPQLNGDIENLEKFLLELAEQNANYCKVSLRIDFKEGLEPKQTITRGESRYNEKLFLEVQYFSPLYEAVIENEEGDILHKIELGKELKSIEYSNAKLNNHDALYTEWRRTSKGNLSKIETDANNFQELIDFLKIENGMSVPAKPSLVTLEKKDVLAPKGEVARVEKKAKPNRKSRRKAKKKSKSKSKNSKEIAKTKTASTQKDSVAKVEREVDSETKVAKQESKEIVKSKVSSTQKDSIVKVEKEVDSEIKVARQESKEIVKSKVSSTQKDSVAKVEKEVEPKVKVEETAKSESKPIQKIVKKSERKPTKSESNSALKISNKKTTPKKAAPSKLEKYSPPTTSTEVVKINKNQSQESSGPREIISDDEMFETVGVEEPLAGMVRFQFPYGKNYTIINESDFSIKINTGRESGKVFADNSIKPKEEKNVKNKFKNGDWYSIVYPEKLHKKDVESYKKSIESILSDSDLSDLEEDFFKMSEQLIPNLDIISNENPLTDTSQKEKVATRFQKFIDEKDIEIVEGNKQKKGAIQLKELLTLIVQSHRLHHYYKYTVGASAKKRPVNKLPRFRKN